MQYLVSVIDETTGLAAIELAGNTAETAYLTRCRDQLG